MPRDTDDNAATPGPPDTEPGPTDVFEAMEPLEPYTTGELAGLLEAPGRLVRRVLDRLADEGRVRKKVPETDRVIWVREPPKHACPECGREFEIKFLHPVLSSVRFCPRCGTRLR